MDYEEWPVARRPDLLVLDCSFPPGERSPRNHNDRDQALAICDRIRATRSLLTHIDHSLDSWCMRQPTNFLPPGVEPARDALQINL